MMLVLLLIVMKSKGKGRVRVSVVERRRKKRERNVWKGNEVGSFLFIHRRVRNYEIPKMPLVQFTGYYI